MSKYAAPQRCPVNPWHESYGGDKIHMPKGYTECERTRMIALRVAKDVRAIYGPDTATTVVVLFDQHVAAGITGAGQEGGEGGNELV